MFQNTFFILSCCLMWSLGNAQKVGIGTNTPTHKLTVVGTTKTDGLIITNSPATNMVLVSDANGVGSWQPMPVAPETDPKLQVSNQNYVPMWNGSSLENGPIGDHAGTAHIDHYLQLNSGTPAQGKVLASDNGGNASWQTGIKTYTHADVGANPTATLAFLGPTISVNISAGQRIFLNTSKIFGSTTGASGLSIFPCYQLSGGVVTKEGDGINGLQCYANTRHTEAVNYILEGLPAGTYTVGMGGYVVAPAAPASWNNNGKGYITVMVF